MPRKRFNRRKALNQLILPPSMSKLKNAFDTLALERGKRDPLFRRDVEQIRRGMTSRMFMRKQADVLYFKALDKSIRRAQVTSLRSKEKG